MRAIFVGIEYAGKSTLIDLLDRYYRKRGIRPHIDDHFTIPDSTLTPDSRAAALHFPDDVKERSQRMQIHYHIDIIRNLEHVLMAGWHIEEAVYAAMYGNEPDSPYYSGYMYNIQRHYEARVLESHLPNLILIHMTASDEAIRHRMQTTPHEYQIIRESDIPELKNRFSEEVEKSLLAIGPTPIVLDTTDKTPQQSLDELLTLSEPTISTAELALRTVPVPDGECEVHYEDGVRKLKVKGE